MKRIALFLAAVLVLALPFACQQQIDQLQAKKAMVATVLATPEVQISPQTLSDFDAGGFDAAGFDAGAFLSDAGWLTIPAQTVAFMFFGNRTSDSLDVPPTAITNATASVSQVPGPTNNLKNEGNGTYDSNSVDDKTLAYAAGKTYDFTATLSGETFTGEVTDSPQPEKIAAFHPQPKGYITQAAKTDFTFTRPDPPTGQDRPLGFVTVFPVSDNGDKGQPTYTNMPQTPLEMLKLIALPSNWKQTAVTVPGSAFPDPKHTYAIVFQSVKSGGPKTDNLFTGSAILAGTADVGVVRTQ